MGGRGSQEGSGPEAQGRVWGGDGLLLLWAKAKAQQELWGWQGGLRRGSDSE